MATVKTIKTIPAKAGFTFCLTCLTEGKQIDFKYPNCIMQCQKCGRVWKVLSAICHNCNTASSVPYVTECKACNSRLKPKNKLIGG